MASTEPTGPQALGFDEPPTNHEQGGQDEQRQDDGGPTQDSTAMDNTTLVIRSECITHVPPSLQPLGTRSRLIDSSLRMLDG